MPNGRKKKGRSRYRGRYRRRRRNNRSTALTRTLRMNTWPDAFRTQMVYSAYNQLDSSAGPAYYFYTMNDIYDPDKTGTGNQPAWYDTYMTIYTRWKVIKSSIVVEVVPAAGGNPVILAVVPTDITTGFTDVKAFSENTYAKSRLIVPGGTSTTKIRNNISVAKKGGYKSIQGQEDLEGFAAVSPAEVYYWGIAAEAMNSTPPGTFLTCKVMIRYDVVFFDRKDHQVQN